MTVAAAGDPDPLRLHATAVALNTRGLLILGPSGSGKSALALRLIALGAALVADDQVLLTRQGDVVLMRAPVALQGRIEARQVGLLRLPFAAEAPLCLVADLARKERARLPEPQAISLLDHSFPVVAGSSLDYLAPALFCYLSGQREA